MPSRPAFAPILGVVRPMTGAMVAGSLLDSGLASRVDPARLASIGLGALVAAGALNVMISSL